VQAGEVFVILDSFASAEPFGQRGLQEGVCIDPGERFVDDLSRRGTGDARLLDFAADTKPAATLHVDGNPHHRFRHAHVVDRALGPQAIDGGIDAVGVVASSFETLS
jgi:hypothetical protein